MSSSLSVGALDAALAELLQGPHYPQHEFVARGMTFAEVYTLASRLSTLFARPQYAGVPFCLAAEDKSLIAAALLAALATGSVLLLPHSFSGRALQQMQDLTGFKAAIVDVARDLPQGTECIAAASGEELTPLSFAKVSAQTELLRLFTGGSTGAPKIWSKTAGNIFGEAFFMARRYTIGPQDLIAATISPYHIYGLLFSVMIPLVASARVLAETPCFPAEIVTIVQQEAATIFASVPAHYRVLRGRETSTALRLAFSSAGMLEQADNAEFCARNEVPVVEVYGSTETGGLATRNRKDGEEYFTPIEPVEWKIREERLYVRSPFLSPDVPGNQEGYFLSGDRVNAQGESSFSLHGRADAITKVGGERVDLDEIRDVLQNQPGVEECVVVPLVDPGGRQNRIAALVRGQEIDLGLLKKGLAASLEPLALPRLIKNVPHIPLTKSGKYDRDAIISLLSSP
ncbi:MAG: fatty acid--CoA ligase family protein [Proteobacteria bacterium]|nr:fatty acid--CoA ligase family protein [Pseudomonadota bacterium]MBU1420117.1 fatty acid--CoA ligase family protein [Pseudomonadota bacterium]MBU1455259.1 fatty acid--CoA ligase family protein [Pseudomonadota bacterium]